MTLSLRLYGTGSYGADLYGVGQIVVDTTRTYPSLFVDKGYNRRPRRDLYFPPTRTK